jgi:hypothetical protein
MSLSKLKELLYEAIAAARPNLDPPPSTSPQRVPAAKRSRKANGRTDWASAPVVAIPVVVPACPSCGCVSFIHWRSTSNGDNSRTELAVCKECSLPFKIVREYVSVDHFPDGEME